MHIDIKRVKIVVTVPLNNTEEVRKALCNAGAGVIGNYLHCSTATKCIGTFMPNANANPNRGKTNNLEYVEENKLEVVCDVKIVNDVLKVLRKIHPYEEPGIDIIPLIDEDYFREV